MKLIPAHSEEHIAEVRRLFEEYADWLGVDLCFQNFDQELLELPGQYAPPDGRVLLAVEGNQIAGCVGLRRIDNDFCEMKRLYVRPVFRGRGVGRQLAEAVVDAARDIGYAKMCLDTLPPMTEAISLYRSLGFREAAPYCHNPLEGAMYMELKLR
jgi:ribosomal protein S18 acetylase RimI-like enzyme